MRVMIVQPDIAHYRVPFYELFNQALCGQLTVFCDECEQSHYRFPVLKGRAIKIGRFRFQWGYWTLIFKRSYDCLFVNFDIHIVSNIALLVIAKLFGVRFVWYGIGFGRSKWARYLRIILAKLADGIMVYENGAAEEFRRMGVRKTFVAHNTVYVSNPGINLSPEERDRFIFLGSLRSDKGIEDLMTAFKSIQAEIPSSVELHVIGGGPEAGHLEQLAADLGIAHRVRFHGQVTEESRLRELLMRGLAVISPRQAGLAILHSFAHGVCFIAARTARSGGELENIKPGETGFLFDTHDQLRLYMIKLANDPQLAVSMGLLAFRHYVTTHRMDHMVNAFMKAVEDLTGKPNRGTEHDEPGCYRGDIINEQGRLPKKTAEDS